MCEKRNSLSDEDKQGIKQAILKAVENGNTDPENLVYRLIYSLERVNNYDSCRVKITTDKPQVCGVGHL